MRPQLSMLQPVTTSPMVAATMLSACLAPMVVPAVMPAMVTLVQRLMVEACIIRMHLSLLRLRRPGASLASWFSVQGEVHALLGLERGRRLHNLQVARGQPAPPPAARRSWFGFLPRLLLGRSAVPPPVSSGGLIFKDLVLVGGGHSHAHVLKMWGMNPEPGVQLTLVTRDVDTPYSGMLPGYVAGAYTWRECHIDLAKLASFAGARLVHAEACGLDLQKKRVLLKGRPPIAYDVLSIDIGSAPKPVASGAAAGQEAASTGTASTPLPSVTPVKPIDGFCKRSARVRRLRRLRQRCLRLIRCLRLLCRLGLSPLWPAPPPPPPPPPPPLPCAHVRSP